MSKIQIQWYLGSLIGWLVLGVTGCSSQPATVAKPANLTNSSQKPGQTAAPSQTAAQKAAEQLGPPGFSQIHMVTAKDGWAIYTHLPYQWVLKTGDGGVQWTNVTPEGSTTRGGIQGQFLSKDAAVTEVLPYKEQYDVVLNITKDSGKTWNPSVMSQTLFSENPPLDAQSPNVLWALMDNYLWNSTDGGLNWSKKGAEFGSQSPGSLPKLAGDNGVLFTTKNQGWVTGLNEQFGHPFLYHTTDGGVSWTSQKLVLPATASEDQITTEIPHFVSQTKGILPVLLLDGSSHSLELFTTSDGGQTWHGSAALDLGSEIKAPLSIGTSGSWAVKQVTQGSGSTTQTILYKTTTGANWKVVAVNPFGSNSGQIMAIDFPTPTDGFAIVAGLGANLYRTINGGRTWSLVQVTIS